MVSSRQSEQCLGWCRPRGTCANVAVHQYAVTSEADHLFRAVIPRSIVATAMAASVSGIGYDNFKASIDPDDWKRAAAYARISAEGQRLQPRWFL